MSNSDKDIPLEALRGIASIVVLFSHIVLGFFPARYGIFPNFDRSLALTGSPIFALFNGGSAVTFFFVLSGYVLSRKFLLTGDLRVLARGSVKRWPRLAGPVLLTVIISWALFALSAYRHIPAAEISGSPWLRTFAGVHQGPFEENFLDAVMQGSFLTFFRGDASYNNNLWTMRYEFIGSFIAFGLSPILWGLKRRTAICVYILALATILCHFTSYNLVAFPIGVGLALLVPKGERTIGLIPAALLLMAAIMLFGYSSNAGGAYRALSAMGLPVQYIHIVASALALAAAELSSDVRRLLSGRWAKLAGDLSFPLYLVHLLVLFSAGSAVFIATHNLGIPYSSHLAAGTTVLVSLGAAVPVLLFNKFWVQLVNRATRRLMHEPAIPSPSYEGASNSSARS